MTHRPPVAQERTDTTPTPEPIPHFEFKDVTKALVFAFECSVRRHAATYVHYVAMRPMAQSYYAVTEQSFHEACQPIAKVEAL